MASKIEWTDETVNPLGWGCYGPGGTPKRPRICSYCYAKALAMRNLTDCPKCKKFKPHWHPEVLEKVWKTWTRKPREIFWQSMGDLWHAFTPYEYIMKVLEVVEKSQQHTHIFLTKNPGRYLYMSPHLRKIQGSIWLGTSITCERDLEVHAPVIMQLGASGYNTYLSIEPILDQVETLGAYLTDCSLKEKRIHGVIVGGLNHNIYHKDMMFTEMAWIRQIRDECKTADVPFFFKGWGTASRITGRKNIPEFGRNHDRLLDGREHNDLPWRPAK